LVAIGLVDPSRVIRLLGHLLEMCRGASLSAELQFQALPLFTRAQHLAEMGIGTGGAKRNWESYGPEVDLPIDAPEWWRDVLCDPQTTGGLLISCSSDSAPQELEILRNRTSFRRALWASSATPGRTSVFANAAPAVY